MPSKENKLSEKYRLLQSDAEQKIDGGGGEGEEKITITKVIPAIALRLPIKTAIKSQLAVVNGVPPFSTA
jgi:hypothetical protein